MYAMTIVDSENDEKMYFSFGLTFLVQAEGYGFAPAREAKPNAIIRAGDPIGWLWHAESQSWAGALPAPYDLTILKVYDPPISHSDRDLLPYPGAGDEHFMWSYLVADTVDPNWGSQYDTEEKVEAWFADFFWNKCRVDQVWNLIDEETKAEMLAHSSGEKRWSSIHDDFDQPPAPIGIDDGYDPSLSQR